MSKLEHREQDNEQVFPGNARACRTAAKTLRVIAADPKHLGTGIGLSAVLHRWGQTLMYHPHLHCIVPGGAPSPDGTRLIACRPNFFLPV